METNWWYHVYAKKREERQIFKNYKTFEQAQLAKTILNKEIKVMHSMGYLFKDIENCSYVIRKSKGEKEPTIEGNLRDIIDREEFIEFEERVASEVGISVEDLRSKRIELKLE